MPKDLGSIRIARLNRLMYTLLSKDEVSRDELMRRMSYTSVRMLQRDIAYLRNEYSVNVFYDFCHKTYKCLDSGHFVLFFKLNSEETAALLIGLALTAFALPEMARSTASLWERLKIFTDCRTDGFSIGRLDHVPSKYRKRYKSVTDAIGKP